MLKTQFENLQVTLSLLNEQFKAVADRLRVPREETTALSANPNVNASPIAEAHLAGCPDKGDLRNVVSVRRFTNEGRELLPQAAPCDLGYRKPFGLHLPHDLANRRKFAGLGQFKGAFNGRTTRFHSYNIACHADRPC